MAETDPNDVPAYSSGELLPLPPMYDDQGRFLLGTPPAAQQLTTPEWSTGGGLVPPPPPPPPKDEKKLGAAAPAEAEVPAHGLLPPGPVEMPPLPGAASPPESGKMLPDAVSGADLAAGAAPPPALPPTTVAEELQRQGAEVRTEGTPAEENAAAKQRAFDQAETLEEREGAYAAMSPEQKQAANEQQERAFEAMTPEQRLREQAKLESLRIEKQNQELLDAETKRTQESQRHYADVVAARNDSRQRRAALEAKIAQAATEKPPGIGIGKAIGGIIASAIGGLASQWTGGRNLGLEGFEKGIERDRQDFQQQQQQKKSLLGMQLQSLDEKGAQDEQDFQSAEAQSMLGYEHLIRQAQIHAQNFAPNGTTAMRIANLVADARGRQAQAGAAFEQQAFENKVKAYNAESEAALRDAQAQEYLAKAGKAKGAGAGGGTGNTQYTVATGFYDPFLPPTDPSAQIMGLRELGAKGKEKGEYTTTGAQIATYGHVQDYWKKLRDVGAKVGYHKSLGESVWKKFKDTDSAEYDAAKEALTVYLTKELGDKLTQGQLEAQAHRIPDRANLLESRDPNKLIGDAQEDADRDFLRDMREVGINADPIIQHARQMRAPAPQPTSEDAIFAAQSAAQNAHTPEEKKNAEAALDAAKEQASAEAKHGQETKAAAVEAKALQPAKKMVSGGTEHPSIEAAYKSRNEAADTYNQLLEKYHSARNAFRSKNYKIDFESGSFVDTKDPDAQSDVRDAALKAVEAKRVLDESEKALGLAREHAPYTSRPAPTADELKFK